MNQETFPDREDFPLRHQQVFGSNEPFFRFSNLINVAKSLLDGNRDHMLGEARSELVEWNLSTHAFVNFSGKLIHSGWNWRMPISDMKNLEESKFDYKKNYL